MDKLGEDLEAACKAAENSTTDPQRTVTDFVAAVRKAVADNKVVEMPTKRRRGDD